MDDSRFYYASVYWAVESNIVTGYMDDAGNPTGYFGPNDPCTREQIITMIWKLKGSPEVEGASPFQDLDTDAYYYKAVIWAAANGITTGVRQGIFGTGEPCTRAMCVTFQYRLAGEPPVTNSSGFTDVKPGSYYEKAVAWAAANGITTGYKDSAGNPTGTFGVKDTCKRGQITTFLKRYENQQ